MGAAYRCRVGEFDSSTTFEKLGHLIAAGAAGGFQSHFHKQTDAWRVEIEGIGTLVNYLKHFVAGSGDWWLLFEYDIPRREARPDVILLAHDVIFVLEFKVGAENFTAADEWQVYSYALDLRDFHAESAGYSIVPVLIATSVASDRISIASPDRITPGGVSALRRANTTELGAMVADLYQRLPHDPSRGIPPEVWESSRYRPTPTVIEAAEQLFAGHQVDDISHAFATNLDATTAAIIGAVQASQRENRRTICFVTGTPGAGKTLTGLNAVHNPALRAEDRPPAVFLSGNGPLVKIVREALIRDKRRSGASDKEAKRVVSTFISNVHGFLVHYGKNHVDQAPNEHVIVFDEAQRAWNTDAVHAKHEINKSEPSLLLEIMERVAGWCTVIALVGGGQEIYKGEAGIEEWGRALMERPERWRVVVSPDLFGAGESVAGHRLFPSEPPPGLDVIESPAMHLFVSVRSPRARLVGQWVDALLQNLPRSATVLAVNDEFPIVLTRDLSAARRWLRERSDGEQRSGLLASSGALRLRAEGIEVSSGFRKGYSYADWFLRGAHDTRSSMALEVAATEFECQGLELDWAGVCWGGDFCIDPTTGRWASRKFRGTRWLAVNQPEERRFIVNKYRVLLTRARKGMVIWVPTGKRSDPTRDPDWFDATARYLSEYGVPDL